MTGPVTRSQSNQIYPTESSRDVLRQATSSFKRVLENVSQPESKRVKQVDVHENVIKINDLAGDIASAEFINAVSKCSKFEKIVIKHCGNLDEGIFSKIEEEKFAHLKKVNITGSKISDSDYSALLKAAPQLRTIIFNKGIKIIREFVESPVKERVQMQMVISD